MKSLPVRVAQSPQQSSSLTGPQLLAMNTWKKEILRRVRPSGPAAQELVGTNMVMVYVTAPPFLWVMPSLFAEMEREGIMERDGRQWYLSALGRTLHQTLCSLASSEAQVAGMAEAS